ncbi:MAG: methyltransferase domain-containing protein [Nitrospirae bacterium]|nr:methyltransferase domain-containing protein [Nitrospirota bacterium]
MSFGAPATDLHEQLVKHLAWWGLRRFNSDDAYFRWQREALTANDLTRLNHLAEQKRVPDAGAAAEVVFYDFAASPHIVPVLYSQRYHYYLAVGPRVAEWVAGARSVMDFGCGVGLLTTFYAKQFPDRSFVGVDRSTASLAVARERAAGLGLSNIRFECLDLEQTPPAGPYDLIVCTHALLQAEGDPGLPSLNWETFERRRDPQAQADFEQRTGLGPRLDRLCSVLTSTGRLIAFEKTRQLARRVPFQRALSGRGLRLLEPPMPIRYSLVEEIVDDGPFYVLTHAPGEPEPAGKLDWDERPERFPDEELFRRRTEAAALVRDRLPNRATVRQERWADPRFGLIQAEWGNAAEGFAYLYLEVGNQPRGILVGSQGIGTELDCQCGRSLGGAAKDSTRLQALFDETWPPSTDQEDPVHTPLYENHTASAQRVWSLLPERRVDQTVTFEDPDGRQTHLELGTARGLVYLYWADTFDQRQLVVVEYQRASLLEQYYQELLQSRRQGGG